MSDLLSLTFVYYDILIYINVFSSSRLPLEMLLRFLKFMNTKFLSVVVLLFWGLQKNGFVLLTNRISKKKNRKKWYDKYIISYDCLITLAVYHNKKWTSRLSAIKFKICILTMKAIKRYVSPSSKRPKEILSAQFYVLK